MKVHLTLMLVVVNGASSPWS